MGYTVPDFIAIPAKTIVAILEKSILVEILASTIRGVFPQSSYAVRSSCLSEDEGTSSMAGQFHTELAVDPAWLEKAIMAVIEQAQEIPGTASNQISIIVQKYIIASYSGVCFTRNPIAWSEMVFEYHAWTWEDLVGGKIIPKKYSYYPNELQKICWFEIQKFQKIESVLWHPQDIEWCIAENVLYFLQTRPITTISREQYEAIVAQEQHIAQTGDYFFEKNEICEIAPRPTPFTHSLLEKIYWENGPVMQVYKKHHIYFTPCSFLRIIGNELYIDREIELRTLLSAMSILSPTYSPKLKSIQGFWRTLHNIFSIILLKEDLRIIGKLKQALEQDTTQESINEAIEHFLNHYQIIFELNIFAAKWLKKLELLLKNEGISISEILQSDPELFSTMPNVQFDLSSLSKLQWNTLEIYDTTVFYHKNTTNIIPESVLKWWNHLPEWKKRWYGPYISRAIHSQQYREYARILMIKNINTMRNILIWEYGNKDIEMIYFSTIDELLDNSIDYTVCRDRQIQYAKNNLWNFPAQIRGRYREPKMGKNQWISPGKVTGFLVDASTIQTTTGPKIFKTQILSPELTQYFPEIVGIISEKWSLLSHLAIIARERGMPVIISNNIEFTLWSSLQMDGSSWKIQEIMDQL